MPWMSVSEIDTWGTCQLQWALKRETVVPKAPVPVHIVGTAVHAALEADNRRRIGGEPAYALDALLAAGAQALTDELARSDPEATLAAQRATMDARVGAVLTAYHAHVASRFAPLTAENWFRFDLEDAPPDPETGEGWRFTGRMDGVMLDTGGRVVIVDYKTGNWPWRSGSEHAKDQATAYLWAAQVFGWAAVEAVVYPIFTMVDSRSGFRVSVEVRRTHRTPEAIAAFKSRVLTVIAELTAARASSVYVPSPGRACRYCPVAPACPALR